MERGVGGGETSHIKGGSAKPGTSFCCLDPHALAQVSKMCNSGLQFGLGNREISCV